MSSRFNRRPVFHPEKPIVFRDEAAPEVHYADGSMNPFAVTAFLKTSMKNNPEYKNLRLTLLVDHPTDGLVDIGKYHFKELIDNIREGRNTGVADTHFTDLSEVLSVTSPEGIKCYDDGTMSPDGIINYLEKILKQKPRPGFNSMETAHLRLLGPVEDEDGKVEQTDFGIRIRETVEDRVRESLKDDRYVDDPRVIKKLEKRYNRQV